MKLPEDVKDSTVYKGWRTAIGYTAVRRFLLSYYSQGYHLYRVTVCVTTSVEYCYVEALFLKEDKVFVFKVTWESQEIQDIKISEKKDAPI